MALHFYSLALSQVMSASHIAASVHASSGALGVQACMPRMPACQQRHPRANLQPLSASMERLDASELLLRLVGASKLKPGERNRS